MDALNDTIAKLTGDVTPAVALAHLASPSPIVRANALDACARLGTAVDVIDAVAAAATSPVNTIRLMGTISVAHLAVAALFRIGSEMAVKRAHELVAKWPEPDRSDLVAFLKSEHLLDWT